MKPADLPLPLLSEAEFQFLCRWVYEQSGIVLDARKRDWVEHRVRTRLAFFPGLDVEDYLVHLQTDPREAAELLDQFTINETYFYRDSQQIEAFEEVLMELLAARSASPGAQLRLWSAGCSIGCEPYTLAMCVQEAVERQGVQVDWTILGTDISPSALEVAASALYSDREVREVPAQLLAKYFARSGDWWQFVHPCRQRVHFRRANLLRPGPGVLGPFDVIFCRNVLIYFDDEGRRQAASVLYDALARGGYLFVGAAESLGRVTRAFQVRRVAGGFVYTRV